MQTVLTIAGFDPSSGAGVTADLMVFAAHSLFGTACITALTVQSTLGVVSTHPTSPAVLRATLDCLEADLPPAGIKIGMIATEDNALVICDYLEKHQLEHWHRPEGWVPVVLDPVLRSTSGRELLDPAAVTLVRDRLLPQVDWITPNLAELAILSGVEVATRDDLPRACRALQTRTAQSPDGHRLGIFATGGHLDPPDDFLLLPTGEGLWLPGEPRRHPLDPRHRLRPLQRLPQPAGAGRRSAAGRPRRQALCRRRTTVRCPDWNRNWPYEPLMDAC